MDTLFIGDIPSDYHYAVIDSDYITLYNQPFASSNQALNYYRIYTKARGFYYSTGVTNFGYIGRDFVDIKTSNNYIYRNDFADILTIVFIFSVFFIFLVNLFTSIVRRGGALSGLL